MAGQGKRASAIVGGEQKRRNHSYSFRRSMYCYDIILATLVRYRFNSVSLHISLQIHRLYFRILGCLAF